MILQTKSILNLDQSVVIFDCSSVRALRPLVVCSFNLISAPQLAFHALCGICAYCRAFQLTRLPILWVNVMSPYIHVYFPVYIFMYMDL